MKTRKGNEVEQQPHNLTRVDHIDYRLSKLEERMDRLEQIIASFTKQPFQPRNIP